MTFTGDIGPRVISDGLILCMDTVSPKCREENDFMELVSKKGMNSSGDAPTDVLKDGTQTVRITNSGGKYYSHSELFDSIIDNEALTIEALVNFEEAGGIGGFVGYNPYWPYSARCVESNGVCLPHFRYQDNAGNWQASNSNAASFPKNTWTHVCLTYDGVNAKTYINSELKYTKALNPTGNTSIGSFHVGKTGWTGPDGNYAFIRLYNKALSQQEVSHNYNVAKRTRGVL